ncbi:hypothetical protein Tco_0632869 [Tanacetum coccineum]
MDNVRPKVSNSLIKRSYYTKPAYRPKDLKPDVITFGVKNMTTAGTKAVISKGKVENWVWRPKGNYQDYGNPECVLQDHAIVDSGCFSHMTGNKAYLSDYKDYNRGFVAFGSDPKGGKITVALVQGRQISRMKGLVCAAQKYFTMEMMFGFGKMMLLGLANLVLPGKFGAVRQIWCCQENLVLSGKFGAGRQIWCCQANLVLPGKFGAARQIWCCKAKVYAACYRYYC